jgi:hypothetical protein
MYWIKRKSIENHSYTSIYIERNSICMLVFYFEYMMCLLENNTFLNTFDNFFPVYKNDKRYLIRK